MTRTCQTMILVAALAVLGAATASAQTPDGLPPALETVCDMETGAAFGWCNAYCEAMDCEVDNTHASATACSKVRTKFQQRTGRDMPCEISCPCTDNPEAFPFWNGVVSGAVTADICFRDGDVCEFLGEVVPREQCESPYDVTWAADDDWAVFASEAGFIQIPIPFCGDSAGFIIPLSPEQGIECMAQLEAALDGLTCGPV